MDFLSRDLDKVKARMNKVLASEIGLVNSTNASLLSRPGKFVRPTLALLVAKACGGDHISEDTISFATAAELLHNATLLHDDVADNSPTRRGAPTVMSIYGGRTSVLLGDFWLVKAMEQILSAERMGNDVIRIFSSTLSDLAEGEMFQLEKAQCGDTNEQDYYQIIHKKTASLFVATAEAAAISVDAGPEQESAAAEFAKNVGLAFQVRDDILDYDGDDVMGKPKGQDLKERKITLPLLGAFANSSSAEEERVRKLLTAETIGCETVAEIQAFVHRNGGVEYAKRALENHVDNAFRALDAFPESEGKEGLFALAGFVAGRDR